jgi:hypothetical protein
MKWLRNVKLCVFKLYIRLWRFTKRRRYTSDTVLIWRWNPRWSCQILCWSDVEIQGDPVRYRVDLTLKSKVILSDTVLIWCWNPSGLVRYCVDWHVLWRSGLLLFPFIHVRDLRRVFLHLQFCERQFIKMNVVIIIGTALSFVQYCGGSLLYTLSRTEGKQIWIVYSWSLLMNYWGRDVRVKLDVFLQLTFKREERRSAWKGNFREIIVFSVSKIRRRDVQRLLVGKL